MKITDKTLFENKTRSEQVEILLQKHFPGAYSYLEYGGCLAMRNRYPGIFASSMLIAKVNRNERIKIDVYGRQHFNKFISCGKEIEDKICGSSVEVNLVSETMGA